MGAAGRREAALRFSRVQMTQKTAELYQAIADRRSGRGPRR
jgi:hypothetical protein